MQNLRLREQLLACPQVPPYKHQVTEQGVFVFAKLEALCKRQLSKTPDAPVQRLLMQMLPKTYMTPGLAVQQWGVRANHMIFASTGGKQGRLVLLHTGFNAVIACDFDSEDERNKAMVAVLTGTPLNPTRPVDFWFDGQPFEFVGMPFSDALTLPVLPDHAQTSIGAEQQQESPPVAFLRKDLQKAAVELFAAIPRVEASYFTPGESVDESDWRHLSAEDYQQIASQFRLVRSGSDQPEHLLQPELQKEFEATRALRPEFTTWDGETLYGLSNQLKGIMHSFTALFVFPSIDAQVLILCLGQLARKHQDDPHNAHITFLTGLWVLAFLRHQHSLSASLEHAVVCEKWYRLTCRKLQQLNTVMMMTKALPDNEYLKLAGPGELKSEY